MEIGYVILKLDLIKNLFESGGIEFDIFIC